MINDGVAVQLIAKDSELECLLHTSDSLPLNDNKALVEHYNQLKSSLREGTLLFTLLLANLAAKELKMRQK